MKAYMPWCSKYSNFYWLHIFFEFIEHNYIYKDSASKKKKVYIYIRTLSCTNSISTLSLTSKLKTYVAQTQTWHRTWHDMGLSNNAFLEKLGNDTVGIQQAIN